MDKTRSQIFWKNTGRIAFILWLVLNYFSVYKFVDYMTEVDVKVTITGKYAVGYSGKHSHGEHLYVVAYNPVYGSMEIPVTPITYESSYNNEITTFSLSQKNIRQYSDSQSYIDVFIILGFFSVIIQGIVSLVLVSFEIENGIEKFNHYLNKKKNKLVILNNKTS